MRKRSLEQIRISVEVDTFAFDPRRVATATGAHMSSYATLVLTFVVLELETKLLITSFESKLSFINSWNGSALPLPFPFR